jgi:hypothetical protein
MISIRPTQNVGSDAAGHQQLRQRIARMQAGKQAEGNADHKRHDQCRHGEFEGSRQSLQDQPDCGLVIDEAVTQIAVGRTDEKPQILLPQRLIEA